MHESLDDGIASRVVTTSGDLFNPEVVVHCRDEYENVGHPKRSSSGSIASKLH
jgi:hypothetical protein